MRKYHPSILHQHTIYIPNLKCQITIGTKNPHWRDSWKMFLNSEHEMSSCLSSCSPGVTSDGIPKLVTTRPSIYIGDEMLEPWSILLSLASTNCQILFARLLASYIYIYIFQHWSDQCIDDNRETEIENWFIFLFYLSHDQSIWAIISAKSSSHVKSDDGLEAGGWRVHNPVRDGMLQMNLGEPILPSP